jgi:predicted mannosyl-3-phosphoglycerate phosphatase (HAD superfamily)
MMSLVSCPLGNGSVPDETVDSHLSPPSERDFYNGYTWCLNAYPTIRQAVIHLRDELAKLDVALEPWQREEVLTNIYLLSCGITSSLEDYLHGTKYRLPWLLGKLPLSGLLLKAVQKTADRRWSLHCKHVLQWKERWNQTFADFLALLIAETTATVEFGLVRKHLAALLPPPLCRALQERQLKVPSGFRRQDLTHQDVMTLGRRFIADHPDRKAPLLVVGLRTSGSYLAPVLQAFLRNEGFATVAMMTLRPQQGKTAEEWSGLTNCASMSFRAVVIDDPPHRGSTVLMTVALLRDAGFASDRINTLLPVHPAAQGRAQDWSALTLADIAAMSLPQAQWYKPQLFAPARVEFLLHEYYQRLGFRKARVVPSRVAERINAHLQKVAETSRGTRLKRVFEVSLEDDHHRATRYVLAKSVGWGWLGYHAYLIGDRLTRFVPPILGLRDGILYSEWVTQENQWSVVDGQCSELQSAPLVAAHCPLPTAHFLSGREQWIGTAADYVAERARLLHLEQDPSPELLRDQRHPSMEMLARVLCGAYGKNRIAALMRGRWLSFLAALPSPYPTLIDGRMRPSEWFRMGDSFRKTDFEHHGLGKYEINVSDPAYDLADFIFGAGLSAEEEARLLARYIACSDDRRVMERLFMNKLLAGLNARTAAMAGLENPVQTDRHAEFHRQFTEAWNFLTVQTVRHCGRHCQKPTAARWQSPLVVLDIDGVLDRRLFGYPSTTAAGLHALSLFHTHGFSVVMNSARSPLEVREYCHGYGLAGGIGEYGSYLYDAVTGRERSLVSPESAAQMERLREVLARIPGVFLNDTYRHSIRANTYADGAPVAVSRLTMQRLLADLRLDRLRYHQTEIDSTVVASEVDKGRGLETLLRWVGLEDGDTTAVGDSSPDLPMFRVTQRSFAPAQISCAHEAKMLGCRIVAKPNQAGLLEIARALVHTDCKQCANCADFKRNWPRGDPFFDLLEAADRGRWSVLFRCLLDPRSFRVFVRS